MYVNPAYKNHAVNPAADHHRCQESATVSCRVLLSLYGRFLHKKVEITLKDRAGRESCIIKKDHGEWLQTGKWRQSEIVTTCLYAVIPVALVSLTSVLFRPAPPKSTRVPESVTDAGQGCFLPIHASGQSREVHQRCVGCENHAPKGFVYAPPACSIAREKKAVVQSACSPRGWPLNGSDRCALAETVSEPARCFRAALQVPAGGNKSMHEDSRTRRFIHSARSVGWRCDFTRYRRAVATAAHVPAAPCRPVDTFPPVVTTPRMLAACNAARYSES